MDKQGSLKTVIEKLEKLYSIFNDRFYNDELQVPVITVSPDTTKKNNGWCILGWCTTWKAWKNTDEPKEQASKSETDKEPDGYYEINMCAEHLARPFKEVCATLLHEMVHLWNLQTGVQDTSRGGSYHNKKFKNIAEEHGLIIDQHPKYGWTLTTLNEEASQFIDTIGKDEQGFGTYRSKLPKFKTASSSSSRKYICPCCGTIIRATKEVNVTCTDCGVGFEEAE